MNKVTIDVAQEVTNSIIKAIEGGEVKPWKNPMIGGGFVRNKISQKSYRGINIFLLWISTYKNNFASSEWLTYRQAQELGGNIKKGEKGTRIVFFKMLELEDRTTKEIKKIPCKKFYTVFNAAQTEGIKFDTPQPADILNSESLEVMNNYLLPYFESERIQFTTEMTGAYYSPSTDSININEAFVSADEFAATLCHETIHSTGHKDRLDRFSGVDNKTEFKLEAYAKEELTAELGCAIVCAMLGITSTYENHVSYIDSWLKNLKSDKNFIFQAAGQAQKAIDFIEGKAEEKEKVA